MTRLQPLTVLLVCSRCRAGGTDPALPRANATLAGETLAGETLAGATLLATTQAAASRVPHLRVQGIACLSGCKRACAAAVMAPGKVGYLFGDLSADDASTEALITVALAHAAARDGYLSRAARPERLRAGILARLPPLHWLAGAGEELAWPA
jgi:predicted metal-binding protein